MLQEAWPSCCEVEADGEISPDLKLRSNHGVMGLHRDFSRVFEHVFMASDLLCAPYLDRYKLKRRKLMLKYFYLNRGPAYRLPHSTGTDEVSQVFTRSSEYAYPEQLS